MVDGAGDGLTDWGLVIGNEGIDSVCCVEERVESKSKIFDLLTCICSNPHLCSCLAHERENEIPHISCQNGLLLQGGLTLKDRVRISFFWGSSEKSHCPSASKGVICGS